MLVLRIQMLTVKDFMKFLVFKLLVFFKIVDISLKNGMMLYG